MDRALVCEFEEERVVTVGWNHLPPCLTNMLVDCGVGLSCLLRTRNLQLHMCHQD